MSCAYWDYPRIPGVVRVLLEVGAERGMPAGAGLAGTGLAFDDLNDPDALVEAGQELQVVRSLVAHCGDAPGLGVAVGVRIKLGVLGIWGAALLSCRTVRDVLDLGPRYYELSTNYLRPGFEADGGVLHIVYDDAAVPEDIRPFMVERDLAVNVVSIASMFGRPLPVRIATALDAERGAALAAALPDYAVTWNGARHTISLDSRLLDEPLISADEEARRRCVARCEEVLDQRQRRAGFAGRVRSALLASSGSAPSLAHLAGQFHIDPRTLRRRLADEGTTYRELVDEVHGLRAVELLSQDGLTVQQVAALLGYAESSSFTRAFRRWTGDTPGAFAARPAPATPRPSRRASTPASPRRTPDRSRSSHR
jgi:AraC-like DNA-binding protein